MDDSSQWEVQWRGEAEVALPDGRRLCIEPTRGEGIARALMLQRQVRVTFRRGGERLSVARDRPRRTLKNLLQECAIPPWERERLPLLFVDDQLVWAHRVGMDPDFCVAGDAEGFRLEVREPAQGR